MSELLTLDDICAQLSVTREYARDRLVKRADFPRPALSLSQKCKRWSREAFNDWVAKQTAKQER